MNSGHQRGEQVRIETCWGEEKAGGMGREKAGEGSNPPDLTQNYFTLCWLFS